MAGCKRRQEPAGSGRRSRSEHGAWAARRWTWMKIPQVVSVAGVMAAGTVAQGEEMACVGDLWHSLEPVLKQGDRSPDFGFR